MTFRPPALQFFRQLEKNNNKEWFEAHRADYESEVREPMRYLIGEMNSRFARFAPEMYGDPKRGMFRINRDIRFSSDKSPYKTHAACWFHHSSATKKVGSEAAEGSAGFYFHFQPGGRSFVGGGLWRPPAPQLQKIRNEIAENPTRLARIVAKLPARYDGLDDESMLKRMPRGYAENHPAAKWLRYQSFTTGRGLTDKQVTSPQLAKLLEEDFKQLLPLARWINRALGFGH
ncbi:MAG TPA: DUF2461 domain-containing protein [Gemmatimonadaceae bacterium]|jgi:uncharacterized protein (TIGR02453 family)|nr:DUF2461 domain-containing protein [Gemmatimonadaceae bacterium]